MGRGVRRGLGRGMGRGTATRRGWGRGSGKGVIVELCRGSKECRPDAGGVVQVPGGGE